MTTPTPRRWCIRRVRSPTAALALAETRARSNGADFLLAFALGIEMTCRLSKAISVPPAKGTVAWSQTGITAGIGAAVAAAKLLQAGCDRDCNTPSASHCRRPPGSA